jgi:O-acetyl-ADP-ribose deacetylase (regulator of RNase III)
MIKLTKGDLLKADAEALVNTVNCVGVSGRGIALQFSKAFPDNFKAYAAACRRGDVQPGRMFVFETGQFTNPRYIINFPTKRHWRGQSRMEDIEAGLASLVQEVKARGIRSLAIPPLGAGLGGLQWAEVRPRIEAALAQLPEVETIIYEPSEVGASAQPAKPSTKVPKMTPGRAVLVSLMERYLIGLLDPYVTLLEVHKLMYFMQEAGEPLKLQYAKGPYGPYAENLRHVLARIDGHLISGYADGVDNPAKQLELVPGAIADGAQFMAQHPDTAERFERVADLVQGFETPFGLELLSTVHWVAAREGATTSAEAEERAYAWSERKRRFSSEQLRLAWNVLRQKGWLPVAEA